MRLFTRFALGLLGLAACAAAAEGEVAVELEKSTFDKFVERNKVVMVDYYAPWCGHCVKFAPKYEAAAKELKDLDFDVKLAKVDCTRQTRLCAEHGIRAYPTMKIYKDGKQLYHDYEGPRRVSAIVSFMAKQMLPTVSILKDKKEHDGFLTREDGEVVLVAYLDSADTHKSLALAAAAEKLHEDFPVGQTSDAEAAKAAGVTIPSLVLYKPSNEGKVVFDGNWDHPEEIKTFAKKSYTPIIGEAGSETWRQYTSGSDGPTLFIFHKTDFDRTITSADLRPVAKKYAGKLQFATAEIPDFVGFAEYLHLTTEPADHSFPAVAIYDGAKKKKYPMDNSMGIRDQWRNPEFALTEKNVEAFVNKYLAGQLEPTIKSEDVPTQYDGPVTTVVAKTYDKIVLDTNKDVLLYFHRTDCPYCIDMNPVYDTLGSMYKAEDRAHKVTISKINILKNDIVDDVPYVPFIKLYKAGDNTAVTYSGDRSVKDLVGFVKEQGTHGVDALHEHATSQDAVHGDAATGGSQKPLAMDKLHEQPLQGRTNIRPLHDEL